jgi:hypothetical protein
MLTVVLFIALAVAVVARLVTVVRTNRPQTPPRSHAHELDPHAAGLLRGI